MMCITKQVMFKILGTEGMHIMPYMLHKLMSLYGMAVFDNYNITVKCHKQAISKYTTKHNRKIVCEYMNVNAKFN